MSRHERRHRLESLEQRRQHRRIRRLGRDLDHLLASPTRPSARRGTTVQIELERSFRLRRRRRSRSFVADRAPAAARAPSAARRPGSSFCRCVRRRRSHTCSALPYLPASSSSGIDAVLHHVRRPPLARDHRVVAEVPPEVVGEVLRARDRVSHAPRTSNVSWSSMKMPPGPSPSGRAERIHVDAVGSAVHGVRRRVPGLRASPPRPRSPSRGAAIARIGLGVDDVDARAVRARHDRDTAARRAGWARSAHRCELHAFQPKWCSSFPPCGKSTLPTSRAVLGRRRIGVDDAERVLGLPFSPVVSSATYASVSVGASIASVGDG